MLSQLILGERSDPHDKTAKNLERQERSNKLSGIYLSDEINTTTQTNPTITLLMMDLKD